MLRRTAAERWNAGRADRMRGPIWAREPWKARIAGPRRTLLRVQHNLRSATNYVDTRLVEHAVNDFELWVGSHAHPAYHQGVFEAMLDVIGQGGYEVVPERVDAEGVTYRIRWES